MGRYKKSGLPSSGGQHSDEGRTSPTRAGGCGAPLVNRFISQQDNSSGNGVDALHVWPRAVKLVRPFTGKAPDVPPALRGEIQSFSAASRRRLKFASSNAFPELISQFGMTYHKENPDGRTVKAHLNAFLTSFRRKFPGAGYLWILEFQRRGTAHFHLFSTLPHSADTGKILADLWHRIAEPDSAEHLRFHRHPSNFIAWDMGSGSYLCKYLDKEAQKAVPAGFTGVGRFWSMSRGLVPDPDVFEREVLDDSIGGEVSTQIVRTLCRHHEHSLKGSPWRSAARKRGRSYTLPNGAVVLRRLMDHAAVSLSPSPPLSPSRLPR